MLKSERVDWNLDLFGLSCSKSKKSSVFPNKNDGTKPIPLYNNYFNVYKFNYPHKPEKKASKRYLKANEIFSVQKEFGEKYLYVLNFEIFFILAIFKRLNLMGIFWTVINLEENCARAFWSQRPLASKRQVWPRRRRKNAASVWMSDLFISWCDNITFKESHYKKKKKRNSWKLSKANKLIV